VLKSHNGKKVGIRVREIVLAVIAEVHQTGVAVCCVVN